MEGGLEAIEAEAWDRVPQGRERPHTRQVAERLGVDLEPFKEQWRQVPGALEQEPPDPRQEALERGVMAALTVGTVALLVWLVVPGRSLRRTSLRSAQADLRPGPPPWVPKAPAGPYPVAGEVLPEAPVNEEGILVSMRAMDACEALVQTLDAKGDPAGEPMRHSLKVSDPWRMRVKGPFTLALNNAGVVAVEVAGKRIHHSRNVGEGWTGRFGPAGEWILPKEPPPQTALMPPETDPEPEESE
jgi:hypothetical protein